MQVRGSWPSRLRRRRDVSGRYLSARSLALCNQSIRDSGFSVAPTAGFESGLINILTTIGAFARGQGWELSRGDHRQELPSISDRCPSTPFNCGSAADGESPIHSGGVENFMGVIKRAASIVIRALSGGGKQPLQRCLPLPPPILRRLSGVTSGAIRDCLCSGLAGLSAGLKNSSSTNLPNTRGAAATVGTNRGETGYIQHGDTSCRRWTGRLPGAEIATQAKVVKPSVARGCLGTGCKTGYGPVREDRQVPRLILC
jgi:hypothetical protein